MIEKNNAIHFGMDGKIINTTLQAYTGKKDLSSCGNDGAKLPERFQIASEFENRVYFWLVSSRHIKAVTRTGFEHIIPDQQFREILRRVASKTTDSYRYAPDFLAITANDKLLQIEVKRSTNIEHDAYLHYITLDVHIPVWLVVESDETVYMQRINNIQFLDSQKYVSQFPTPFEVDNDGWILPRPSSNHSSCPFKVINLETMNKINLEVNE